MYICILDLKRFVTEYIFKLKIICAASCITVKNHDYIIECIKHAKSP